MKFLVGNDYHIRIDNHFYSVPYQLAFKEVEARVTADTVEILHGGKRIASHKRDLRPNKSSTKREHRTPAHQHMSDWNPERLLDWAIKIGPATRHLVEQILQRSHHEQIGMRACLGLLSLHKDFGRERLEAACRRALSTETWSVTSIRSMLKHGLDQQSVQLSIPDLHNIAHSNIRGANYFRTTTSN